MCNTFLKVPWDIVAQKYNDYIIRIILFACIVSSFILIAKQKLKFQLCHYSNSF